MQHITAGLTAAIMAILISQVHGAKDPKPMPPPNLIVLLADDMGYQDPSCFGGTAVKTPNIDRIAADGIKFSNFYAASAVCSPTRASILTGRYPIRYGITRHLHDGEEHLNPQAVTLPKLLKQKGYATAHVGKWHLGGLHLKHTESRDNGIPGPHQHGFDHYLCQNEEKGGQRNALSRKRELYQKGGTVLLRNDQLVGPEDPYYNMYYTDINGSEAVRVVEEMHSQDKPFFLNLWWVVPHTPYEPSPEPHWSQTAAQGISDNQHRFRSMVARMDYQIGKLLDKLEELGIRDNTIILFTSDNGGAWEADIGPYKGGKTDLHEGGLRVPMMVSWPERIKPGQTTDLFGHSNDILPTFCAAAGIAPPANVDGKNLLPHMIDMTTELDRGTVFWQLDLYKQLQRHTSKIKPYAKEIVRRGQWKMLCFNGVPQELFNIKTDPLEKTNLLNNHPELVSSLKKELDAWLAEPRLSMFQKK